MPQSRRTHTDRVVGRSRVRNGLAVGTWAAPRDGVAHLFVAADVTDAEAWCADRPGVTLTHLLGSAVAAGLVVAPDLNSRVVLGRVRRRAEIDVSYVVDVGRGSDMTALCVRRADTKSPRDTARELLAGARAIRRGDDPQFSRATRVASRVPGALVRPGMAVAGFVTGGLGRPFGPLHLPAHPFGSALVSSVGPWGLERVLPPAAPFARLGFVLVLGAPGWRAAVVDGHVRARRVVDVGMTIDHRLVDGAQVGAFTEVMQAALERPSERW